MRFFKLLVCLFGDPKDYLFIYLLTYFTLQINRNVLRLKNLKICHIQKEQLRSERFFSVTLINFRNIFWLFILNSNVLLLYMQCGVSYVIALHLMSHASIFLSTLCYYCVWHRLLYCTVCRLFGHWGEKKKVKEYAYVDA